MAQRPVNPVYEQMREALNAHLATGRIARVINIGPAERRALGEWALAHPDDRYLMPWSPGWSFRGVRVNEHEVDGITVR